MYFHKASKIRLKHEQEREYKMEEYKRVSFEVNKFNIFDKSTELQFHLSTQRKLVAAINKLTDTINTLAELDSDDANREAMDKQFDELEVKEKKKEGQSVDDLLNELGIE